MKFEKARILNWTFNWRFCRRRRCVCLGSLFSLPLRRSSRNFKLFSKLLSVLFLHQNFRGAYKTFSIALICSGHEERWYVVFRALSGIQPKLSKLGNSGTNVSRIWVCLARLSSFWEILDNAVPFATKSCRKFKPDVLVWMESALKVRKNGQQKTCNLICNIAAKRVAKRHCAFYHPDQTCLATNQVVDRFERRW